MVDNPTDKEKKLQRRKDDHVLLESWKAIANHLNRSVRTVRRWEATEGLPVRRHKHGKGASVYAYRVELDHWTANRRDQDVISPEITTKAISERVQRLTGWTAGIRFAAVFVAGVAIGTIGSQFLPDNSTAPTPVASPASSDELGEGTWSRSIARTLLAPVFDPWVAGDVDASATASQDLQKRLRDVSPDVRELVSTSLVQHALSLGRTEEADILIDAITDEDLRTELRAAVHFAAGRNEAMRTELEEVSVVSRPETALFMAMAGMPDAARAANDQLGSAEDRRRRGLVIDALTEFKAGKAEAAESRLNVAALSLTIDDQAYFFVGLDVLSRIHQQGGDLVLATEVLENTMGKQRRAAFNGTGVFWLMCQGQLSRLYRAGDRLEESGQIESNLKELLARADASFPMAKEFAAL